MRFAKRHVFGCLMLLPLAGCMSGTVPEGRMFRESAIAIDTASAGLLDELSNAEREIAITSLSARQRSGTTVRSCGAGTAGRSGIPDFCPDDAAIQGGVGDPPGTARLRRGIAAVNAQALLLVALSEQASPAEREARLGRLTSELTALIAAANGPGTDVFRPVQFDDAVEGMRPVAASLVSATTPAAIRSILLDAEQATEALIAALRGAPTVFFRDQANQIAVRGLSSAAQMNAVRRLESERRLLADYLQLLDRATQNWRSAAQLARFGRPATFSALSDTAVSSRIEAEGIRRARAR